MTEFKEGDTRVLWFWDGSQGRPESAVFALHWIFKEGDRLWSNGNCHNYREGDSVFLSRAECLRYQRDVYAREAERAAAKMALIDGLLSVCVQASE